MRKLNKKGVIIPLVAVFQVFFGVAAVSALWHIPAWSEAKANHTEAIYQAQQMWPQQVFHKVPNTAIAFRTGNEGNFVGGYDKRI